MKIKAAIICVLTVALYPAIGTVKAAEPWDEPFAKDTQAIAARARSTPQTGNPEVVVLLADYQYAIHADGRIDAVVRRVYRVIARDAVDEWSSIEQNYQPWYQQKPAMRARVIAADGTAQWLDSKSIADSPAREFDSNVFSDDRVARAPLPTVTAGSIVETEVTTRDKVPLLDAGVTRRIAFEDGVPVVRFHVAIDAEPGVPLKTAYRLLPESAVRRETNGKRTRVECEAGPLEPPTDVEFNLPPDVAAYPYLSFSTGETWQSIAARYGDIVSERLSSADVKPYLEGLDLKGTPLEVAARLTAKLHKSVRYTGVEFGQAAIVPATPGETLQRGYGDCKDKATTLVALLRAAGLKADVALLDSGFGTDVDSDLPGLGTFDHAIVYVASEPPLWIDATATDTRVGSLPAADQGRLALIANRQTTTLIKTPEAASSDNWERHTIEVKMADFGPGSFSETVEFGGSFETRARLTYATDPAKLKEQLEKYAKEMFAAKSLGKFEVGRREDFNAAFRIKVEALGAKTAATGLDDAAFAIAPNLLLQNLPFILAAALNQQNAAGQETKPRGQDFLFPEPFLVEYRFKITLPPLFKPGNLPSSEELKLGPVEYTRKFQNGPDGQIDALYRIDTGKRRLSPAEYEELHSGLQKHFTEAQDLIKFVPEESEHQALGQWGKAIALVRDYAAHHKESAMLHIRLSHVLLTAGLGGVALSEAKAAVAIDPKSEVAWLWLAAAYEHDTFGRPMTGNWNMAESEKCYRKALELEPEDVAARTGLAALLEHNNQGWRYAKDARLEEAIALYRQALEKQPTAENHFNLAVVLVRMGRLEAAKEEAKKSSGDYQAALLAVISAMQDGAGRAIANAQLTHQDPAQQALFLASVGASLAQLRQYALAQAFTNAAARVGGTTDFHARAEMMVKLKRSEDSLVEENDPVWPVQQVVLHAIQNDLTPEILRSLVSRRATLASWDKMATLHEAIRSARSQLARLGLDEAGLADWMLSFASFEKKGDPARGYRVEVMAPGGLDLVMYVVREDKYRIIDTSAERREAIGELVLDLLNRGDIEGAQWWLDQVVRDTVHTPGRGLPAVYGIWSGVKPESRGPDTTRIAAASLIGLSTGQERAIEILEAAQQKAATPLERAQLDKAICESLETAAKWDRLMVAAKRLEGSKMFSGDGFRYFVRAATAAGKWKALEAEARVRVESPVRMTTVLVGRGETPSKKQSETTRLDETAVRALALALLRQGNAAGAAEWMQRWLAISSPARRALC